LKQYVISKLIGQKTGGAGDSVRPEYAETVQWKYVSADDLGVMRAKLLLKKMLKDALIRINPEVRAFA